MSKRSIWIVIVAVAALAALGFYRYLPFGGPKAPPTIAIATLMPHPALEQVEQGLEERLRELGYRPDENLVIIHRNAGGQVQLAASIASELSARDLAVYVAITTPMAQAAVQKARCPVVFAAVTDPVGARLISSLDKPEERITGTVDAWPYKAQLELIREVLPAAKRLGVLYNPGEAASQYGIVRIREAAPKFGFEIAEAAVSTSAEVYPAAQSLEKKVDALFLSSDNTVISGVAGAVKVAVESKKPLFVGDSGTVEKGGLGAVSVGYHQLGRDTGDLVARFLKGERRIPVVVATGADIYLNREAARRMGVTLSEALIKRATQTYDAIVP